MLQRNIERQVLDDLNLFPVVGIVGPRQVGKTTLSKIIQSKIREESLYIDLELDTDRSKLNNAEEFLKFHQNKCIIIDEIQRMPSLFPLLRALVDMERRAGRFIILGSASPSLIKNSSETLAGRIAYTELAPISLEEIESTDITMNEHWLRGGFPEALLAIRNHNASRWLQQFIETFIYRDLGELNYNVNANVIRKLLEMLAILNGNILNMSNLSRSLGVTQPTIARYLDILEGGFIIRRLEPYYINAKKRVVKSPKIYIRDSGLLHNILNIKNYDELISNPAIGASWEGYVVEELYRKYHNKGWRFYFYRTHKGAEADLLAITENGEKICIEIKFSESAAISRGFYETIEDIKANRSYVVVSKGIKTPKKKGVILYNIKEALKEI